MLPLLGGADITFSVRCSSSGPGCRFPVGYLAGWSPRKVDGMSMHGSICNAQDGRLDSPCSLTLRWDDDHAFVTSRSLQYHVVVENFSDAASLSFANTDAAHSGTWVKGRHLIMSFIFVVVIFAFFFLLQDK